MRGAWIASVKNIDWPSQPGLSVEVQKHEFNRMAGFLHDAGFNTLIAQVRPATDAMYLSEHETWSQWLNGKQGKAPSPLYDPMNYMIEKTHDLGMEFHAWFNPYRAVVDADSTETALDHITRLRPGWFVRYGSNMYFDPGIPEVRDYLVNVIKEVVHKYDVDAIHFDDYFYPYKINGEVFPDSLSFVKYGRDFSTVEDWRRNNVDQLIHALNKAIKAEKDYVKFGISPFGVWRNKAMDDEGSATQAGVTNYDDLYADVRKWLKKGWIDYIVPQIYWHIGFEAAEYKTLAEWWSKNSFDKHLYIGQAVYRVGGEINEAWKNPSEMPDHLRWNKNFPEIAGDMYFKATTFYQNPLGITDSLRKDFYAWPAFTPPMLWIDNQAPQTPNNLELKPLKNGIYLEWKSDDSREEVSYYVVYRNKGKSAGLINDPRNIIAKVRHPLQFYKDLSPQKGRYYTYQVTALDRLNNESPPSVPVTIKFK